MVSGFAELLTLAMFLRAVRSRWKKLRTTERKNYFDRQFFISLLTLLARQDTMIPITMPTPDTLKNSRPKFCFFCCCCFFFFGCPQEISPNIFTFARECEERKDEEWPLRRRKEIKRRREGERVRVDRSLLAFLTFLTAFLYHILYVHTHICTYIYIYIYKVWSLATRPLRRPFGTELNLALKEVKDLCSRLQSCAAKKGEQKKAARRESGADT